MCGRAVILLKGYADIHNDITISVPPPTLLHTQTAPSGIPSDVDSHTGWSSPLMMGMLEVLVPGVCVVVSESHTPIVAMR